MAKLTLSDLTSILGNEGSAITVINANSDLIEAAMENTLSRDGTSPNVMNADIDLNDNDLNNVGTLGADTVNAGALYIDGVLVSEGVSAGTTWGSISGTLSTQTDLQAALDGKQDASTIAELIRDTIGTALVQGSNVTITVNDPSDTITIDAASGAPTDVDYLVKTSSASLSAERVVTDNNSITWDWGTAGQVKANVKEIIGIACSDETTALTTGTSKATFVIPRAFTVTAVYAGLGVVQSSGSIFTVDINEAGSTILSTKLTIDNSEASSTTAATPAVISDSSLAAGSLISVDIDQVGDGTAQGLKVFIEGYWT